MSIDRREEERLARKRANMLSGRKVKPGEVKVKVWLPAWRLLFPETQSERTRRNELDMLRPFIREFGEMRMRDVTAMQAQAWALAHPAQVRWLRAAWKKAVVFRVAEWDIWSAVVMPVRTRERRRPPTDQELAAILRRCAEGAGWLPAFGTMVETAAYTGARQGGLLGVRWREVDLDTRRMTVTEKGGKARTVVIPEPAASALERAFDFRLRVKGPPAWQFVWHWHDGTALTADRVQKAWGDVRGDFPHGFHSLRHYAASWWKERGADELDIAVQLGHTDSQGRPYVRHVERVYVHPAPDANEKALGRLAAL